jgi:hypothetical protein
MQPIFHLAKNGHSVLCPYKFKPAKKLCRAAGLCSSLAGLFL